MLKNDLQLIVDASKKGKCKSIVLFGSYGKGEGVLIGGKPVNDLDILLVDANDKCIEAIKGITTSVPLDIILADSKDFENIIPTQMWWEIRYGSILLDGDPLRLHDWKAWEIPYWDAVESINKRCVSMIIAKHELMKKEPNYKKVFTQIGKAIIAIGDAQLIKRGRFDHRYSVRSLMLMFDEIAADYRMAVSHKLLNEPDLTPDDLWNMWMRTRNNLREYVTDNDLRIQNLDVLLSIRETTTQEQISEVIKALGAERWL